jgi:uncharacterized membrane protein YkvA (DUF1232 family)
MTNENSIKPISWVLLILAIVYTVSPVDIIPDVIPIAGWLDDFTLLATTGLNVIQQGFASTSSFLSNIAKALKWIILLLGLILIGIILLFGTLIYKLIS